MAQSVDLMTGFNEEPHNWFSKDAGRSCNKNVHRYSPRVGSGLLYRDLPFFCTETTMPSPYYTAMVIQNHCVSASGSRMDMRLDRHYLRKQTLVLSPIVLKSIKTRSSLEKRGS